MSEQRRICFERGDFDWLLGRLVNFNGKVLRITPYDGTDKVRRNDMPDIEEVITDSATSRIEKDWRRAEADLVATCEERDELENIMHGLEAEGTDTRKKLVVALDELRRARRAGLRALGFFSSAVKCAEPWTSACDEEYRAAFVSLQDGPDPVTAVVKAARTLETKMREVDKAGGFRFGLALAYVHGMTYKGPNFAEEWEALTEALKRHDAHG